MSNRCTPSYRNTPNRGILIGFDSLLSQFIDSTNYSADGATYPPYNIIKVAEDKYAIEVAIAGFSKEFIDIEVDGNALTIKGFQDGNKPKTHYIYKGIANREFVRKFTLAEYSVVTSAVVNDGLLVVSIERQLPESLKPRKVALA